MLLTTLLPSLLMIAMASLIVAIYVQIQKKTAEDRALVEAMQAVIAAHMQVDGAYKSLVDSKDALLSAKDEMVKVLRRDRKKLKEDLDELHSMVAAEQYDDSDEEDMQIIPAEDRKPTLVKDKSSSSVALALYDKLRDAEKFVQEKDMRRPENRAVLVAMLAVESKEEAS